MKTRELKPFSLKSDATNFGDQCFIHGRLFRVFVNAKVALPQKYESRPNSSNQATAPMAETGTYCTPKDRERTNFERHGVFHAETYCVRKDNFTVQKLQIGHQVRDT